MIYWIPFTLLLFEFGCSSGHTLPRKEIENVDVYSVQENDHDALTIVNPKSKTPNVKEIVYFHVIESPYEKSQVMVTHKEETVQTPDFDETRRPETNAHGLQFNLSASDNDDDDNDEISDESIDSEEVSAQSSAGDDSKEDIKEDMGSGDVSMESGDDDSMSDDESEDKDSYEDDNVVVDEEEEDFNINDRISTFPSETKLAKEEVTSKDNVNSEVTEPIESSTIKMAVFRKKLNASETKRAARDMLFDQLQDRYQESLEQNAVASRKKRDVQFKDSEEDYADNDKELLEIPEAPILPELKADELPKYTRDVISTEKSELPDIPEAPVLPKLNLNDLSEYARDLISTEKPELSETPEAHVLPELKSDELPEYTRDIVITGKPELPEMPEAPVLPELKSDELPEYTRDVISTEKPELQEMPEAPVLPELNLDELPEYPRDVISETPEQLKSNDEIGEEAENHTEKITSDVTPYEEDADDSEDEALKKPRTYGMKLKNGAGYIWNDLWTNPGISYNVGDSSRFSSEEQHEENEYKLPELQTELAENNNSEEVQETSNLPIGNENTSEESSSYEENSSYATEPSTIDITKSYDTDKTPVEEEGEYVTEKGTIFEEIESHQQFKNSTEILRVQEENEYGQSEYQTEQTERDKSEEVQETTNPDIENESTFVETLVENQGYTTEQSMIDITEAYGENETLEKEEENVSQKGKPSEDIESESHQEIENTDILKDEIPEQHKSNEEKNKEIEHRIEKIISEVMRPYEEGKEDAGESKEEAAKEPRKYGMKLNNGTGYVWNDLWNKSEMLFDVDDSYRIPSEEKHNEENGTPQIDSDNTSAEFLDENSYQGNITEQSTADITEAHDKDKEPQKTLEDIESHKPKLIENIIEVLKDQDEDFWIWLQDWTSTYMDIFVKHIKKVVEQEVRTQINLNKNTEDHERASVKDEIITIDGVRIPLTHNTNTDVNHIFNNDKITEIYEKSHSELLKGRRHKQKDKETTIEINKVECELDQRKPDSNTVEKSRNEGKIDANNIFGNSYNNDKVTNIYIFYPNDDSKKIVTDLNLDKDKGTKIKENENIITVGNQKEELKPAEQLEPITDNEDYLTTPLTPTVENETFQSTETFNEDKNVSTEKSEDKIDENEDNKWLSSTTQSDIAKEDTTEIDHDAVNSVKVGEDTSERNYSEISDVDINKKVRGDTPKEEIPKALEQDNNIVI